MVEGGREGECGDRGTNELWDAGWCAVVGTMKDLIMMMSGRLGDSAPQEQRRSIKSAWPQPFVFEKQRALSLK